jgi:predicted enzyme involved in methoxymalonyl-ACP biosynthesis
MSCRALGRRVEETFSSFLAGLAAADGKPLRGTFVPTKKNTPIRELLDRHHWWLDDQHIEVAALPIPTWLQLVVK